MFPLYKYAVISSSQILASRVVYRLFNLWWGIAGSVDILSFFSLLQCSEILAFALAWWAQALLRQPKAYCTPPHILNLQCWCCSHNEEDLINYESWCTFLGCQCSWEMQILQACEFELVSMEEQTSSLSWESPHNHSPDDQDNTTVLTNFEENNLLGHELDIPGLLALLECREPSCFFWIGRNSSSLVNIAVASLCRYVAALCRTWLTSL